MRARERSKQRDGGGGVLADDMGMGKTLDCIALISSTAEDARSWAADCDVTSIVPSKIPATLIVAPLCLLDQWRAQIVRHGPPRSPIAVYHGPSRDGGLASLLTHIGTPTDGVVLPAFVLTTYETVCSDHKRSAAGACAGVLAMEWYRIVLDEAHRIRASESLCHEAAMALRGQRRWCVTGTPYNNSLRDIEALARFIGVAPYDTALWWQETIATTTSASAIGRSAEATECDGRLARWRDEFVLMRDKATVLGDTLPPCTTTIVRVRMDAAERAFYDDLMRSAARAYAAFAAAPPKDRAKPRMFGAVLAWVSRLRQACDHPLLAMGRGWTVDAMASGQDREPARCGCCARLRDADPAGGGSRVVASCGHWLCRVCAPVAVGSSRRRRGRATPCISCRAALRWASSVSAGPKRASTKLRALVAYCTEALAADPTTRIVVFSQWTACLDMAACFLAKAGVTSERYDGDVAGIARRTAVLAAFATSVGVESPEVPVASTQVGELPSSSSGAPWSFSGTAPPGRASDLTYGNRHHSSDDETDVCALEGHVDSGMRLRSGATVGRAGDAARVLLASLHCAGVGLDLSAANHVVLIDAWYNPFIEKQACDRVHRIGQTREVKVVRLCVAASVEADVARIQARKLCEAAAFGLGAHAAPIAPSDDDVNNNQTTCPSSDDRDSTRTALSDTDIHEIFRRAMARCRLCPVPALAPRSDRGSTAVVVATGKRKRD
jgi:SNF2 family DNA or RNA helicase